jgi:hypothetical protein
MFSLLVRRVHRVHAESRSRNEMKLKTHPQNKPWSDFKLLWVHSIFRGEIVPFKKNSSLLRLAVEFSSNSMLAVILLGSRSLRF